MEIIDSPTAPIAKPQPVKPPVFECSFNANLLLGPFWSIVQATLADAVKEGQLHALDFGIYQGSQKQVDAFHADLDKRLATFTKNL
ncbi:MAG: hypothetical protein LV481_04620 [Methylacidiphilales bacterium]|nr:hypothetical protein [Candidatus Methylacidiphilales bacterium]